MPKKVRVLHLDDSEVMRSSLATIYGIHGIDATLVASPEEALSKVREGGYDAVVVDLSMRGQHGQKPKVTPLDVLVAAEQCVPAPKKLIFTFTEKSAKLSGVEHITKDRTDALIEALKRPSPAKPQRRVELNEFKRPLRHVTPAGEVEWVQLIDDCDNQEVLAKLRQGWRPKTTEQLVGMLREQAHMGDRLETLETLDPSALAAMDRRTMRNANRLQRGRN